MGAATGDSEGRIGRGDFLGLDPRLRREQERVRIGDEMVEFARTTIKVFDDIVLKEDAATFQVRCR